MAPTTLYDTKEVERIIDGVKMKIFSAVGESDDQLCIWLEEDKVLCTGDNYGTIEWSVRGIYNGYVGWFDGNPVNLLPSSDKEYAETLLSLINDDNVIIEKIRVLMTEENYQMALQLIEVLSFKNNTDEVKKMKREALLQRARQMTSANARHYYIASAKELLI